MNAPAMLRPRRATLGQRPDDARDHLAAGVAKPDDDLRHFDVDDQNADVRAHCQIVLAIDLVMGARRKDEDFEMLPAEHLFELGLAGNRYKIDRTDFFEDRRKSLVDILLFGVNRPPLAGARLA